tara:strand:+ start:47 stop:220 length:174 start_codon:yes stop_codon:yes gene_type:complete
MKLKSKNYVIFGKKVMKNTKQYRKLNNLQVKAEKCITREEAKKILNKANKTQDKINI